VKIPNQKILILSYYWPPAGGSGTQRWMYFAKYLKKMGCEPIVITVDEQEASYSVLDKSLLEEVDNIRVIKTSTREPLKLYSFFTTGNFQKGIPQGAVKRKSILEKIFAYIRGNFFIPDARKGWIPFAVKAAEKILNDEIISHIVTTGPPHSTHLAGLRLKTKFDLKWWVDFRDPWTNIFYNNHLYRSSKAIQKDIALEKKVLQSAEGVITTVGGELHKHLKAKAPNQEFYVIQNGYDSQLMQEVHGVKLKDLFHVVYTGLLTENQAYDSVLKVLNKMANQIPIRLSLAGNINKEIIERIRLKYTKIEFIFLGYLSHRKSIQLMKSANLLINFIFEGANAHMISGKVLEYLATGVPTLSIGDPDSEAGIFINQGSASKMINAKDDKGITEFIQQLADQKENFQNNFPDLKRFSREELTKKLLEELFLGNKHQ